MLASSPSRSPALRSNRSSATTSSSPGVQSPSCHGSGRYPQPQSPRHPPRQGLKSGRAPSQSPVVGLPQVPRGFAQTQPRHTSDAATQWSPLVPVAAPPSSQSSGSGPKSCAGKRRPSSSPKATMAEENARIPELEASANLQHASIEGQAGKVAGSALASASASASAPASVTAPRNEASPKRARPPRAAVKMLPSEYQLCDVKDLVRLIADMLMELVRFNDDIPLKDGRLTRFHSRAPPAISVADYLQRLTTHATLPPPILLSMVYYIDRLCALYPAFIISSLTVHRFLIVSATVAAKGLSDSFWTNNTYARVGGVSLRELALLELEFLDRMQWKIVPQPEMLVDYYKSLVERSDAYEIEGGEAKTESDVSLPDIAGDAETKAEPAE